MRAVRKYWLILAVLALPSLGSAQSAAVSPAPAPTSEVTEGESPAPPESDARANSPPPALTAEEVVSAPFELGRPPAPPEPPEPVATQYPRAGGSLARGSTLATESSRSPFRRDYAAWPLTLEARVGFNARLGESFDASAHEQLFDFDYSLGAFLAWSAEYALGVELEHAGLGRVRALSGQNSIDAAYSATGAWLGARAFPIRRERFELFVQLRVGVVLQHVDALGTRAIDPAITVPARSFSCAEWAGPGFGLGGAVGSAYRLSRHVSAVSRLDATGQRLSGDPLAGCAGGIGSVASVSGTVGLAYEFETARP